jgi:FtsH-binding integral membrane protein
VSESRGQPGIREVLLVAAVVLLAVLAAAAVTGLVPPLSDLMGRTPVAILVLIAGTAFVLWRLAARPPTG